MTTSLEAEHTDAPAVDVQIGNAAGLSGVDYKVGSGRLSVIAGTYSVQVDGITPGGLATVWNMVVLVPGVDRGRRRLAGPERNIPGRRVG